jgi:hypothetical protein
MATIQHSALPNSELHEPKHILTSTTADAGKVITPSSVTSGTSQLRLLTLDDLSDSGVTSWTGWAQYDEGTAISEATGVGLTATTRTKLSIDGLGSLSNDDGLPSGIASFWDAVNDKVAPAGLNDAYDIRLSFVAQCATANAYIDIELDVGGSLGTIAQQTSPFLKTVDQYFQVNIPVFAGATFLANGGTFYVTASDATTLWSPRVLVIRTHKGA